MARLFRSIVVILATLAWSGSSGHASAAREGGQPPAPQPAPPATAPQNPPGGQPPADPQQPPVFRTGINFVRVDVIVTDNKNGVPLADLQASDFDVTEDGKAQKIETFRLIKLDGGAAAAAT